MNTRVSVDDLAKEIEKTLRDYADATEEDCVSGVKKTAKDAVEKLHSAHPHGSGKYGSWDKYNKGWAVRNEPRKKRKSVLAIVHNKTHYRLTHLLEKGHAKQNGGRTRAFPHIAPVAEEAEKELLENIKREIQNG